MRALTAALVPLSLLLAALPAHAYTVRLTAAEIEAVVRPHFPKRGSGPFGAVVLSNPKVVLAPGSDRLGIGLDVDAELPGGVAARAAAVVDGEVGYDPGRREFHLREPRLKSLAAEGLEEPYASMLAEAVTGLARARMPVIMLYRIPAGDPALGAAARVLKGARVRDGRLELELGP